MKKVLSLALCAIMLIALSVMTVVAAGDLNEYEQAIMDELKEKVSIGDIEMIIPSAYFNYVENYFRQDGVSLTEDQANTILAEIAASKAAIVAGGELAYNDMSSSTTSAVLENIKDAAAAIGLNAEFNANTQVVTLKDANGAPVMESMDVTEVRATGSSVSVTTIVVAALSVVAALGLCVVIAKKAKVAAAA